MNDAEPSPNPYAAPQAPLTHSATDPRSWLQRIANGWKRGVWPLVFLFNLVLPGLIGFLLCSNHGLLGMALTTLGMLLFITWLASRNPLLGARWIEGGKSVAVLQFLPIFHLLILWLSLAVLSHFHLLRISFWGNEKMLDFWPACLFAFLVGCGLLGFAYLLGLLSVKKTDVVLPAVSTRKNL